MVRQPGDRPAAGAVLTPELEQVETAARAQQYAGLGPEHRALVAALGPLTVLGVGAWPESAWHATVAGLHASPSPGQLDAALALLARLGAQQPVLPVVEGTLPTGLLRERGFAPATTLLRVATPTGPPATTGPPAPTAVPELPLRVDAVGPTSGALVATLCLKGFGGSVDQAWWRAGLGRPGFTQLVAWAGDVPVGTAALFVDGEHAWVGSATTVPQARRCGVHARLLAARLVAAAEQGATQVSTACVPGSPAARALARVGFHPVQRVVQWRRPAP